MIASLLMTVTLVLKMMKMMTLVLKMPITDIKHNVMMVTTMTLVLTMGLGMTFGDDNDDFGVDADNNHGYGVDDDYCCPLC